VRLRYISNFTDFDPFLHEPDVDLVYSLRDEDIEHADLVIVPGSKNTVQDLLFLRETGIEASIKRAAAGGTPVVGICGGYQMLGRKICDPFGVESNLREVAGMGLLDVETEFDRSKTTCQAEARVISGSGIMGQEAGENMPELKGYEIHMGRTTGDVGLFQIRRLASHSAFRIPHFEIIPDGSAKGTVWGTYLHGIFDNDRFRHSIINAIRVKRGRQPIGSVTDYGRARENALDRWSATLAEHVDIGFIENLIS
jgi:adenosylcobyric acid synthase